MVPQPGSAGTDLPGEGVAMTYVYERRRRAPGRRRPARRGPNPAVIAGASLLALLVGAIIGVIASIFLDTDHDDEEDEDELKANADGMADVDG
jgi:hypothetical protein